MKIDAILAALDLPSNAIVNQRIPKSLLLKNGAPTAGDKRKISEGIEEIQWLAAIKPTTAGVPEYQDAIREYLEIAVISVEYRENAQTSRLNELIHRAIPYPVFLISAQGETITISLSHKRWAQNQVGATVLEGDLINSGFNENNIEINKRFLRTVSLTLQPQKNIFELYQGWIDTVIALLAAQKTGSFKLLTNRDRAIQRQEALKDCCRLEMEITRLSIIAKKEKQVPRLVTLNIEIKQLKDQLKKVQGKL